MSKILGMILALAGLAVVVFYSTISKVPFLSTLKPAFILIFGLALVILGIVFIFQGGSSSGSNPKQAAEEVPIYEGEGKKRRIVAYRKAGK